MYALYIIYYILYIIYYILYIIYYMFLYYILYILLFSLLHYFILNYIILYYVILYYIIWCYIILYYIISFGWKLYCHLSQFWSLDTVLALDTRKCVLMAPCVSPSYSSIFLVDSTSVNFCFFSIKSSRMNTWKTWKWNLATNNSECSLGSVNFLQPIHFCSFSRSSRI